MLPSILNDSTSFWLDFAGSRLPEASKIKEKMNREISIFFNREKRFPGLFFCMSWSILGSVLEPGAAIRARFFCHNALNHRSWVNHVLPGRKKGPFWDQFSRPELQFGLAFHAQGSCRIPGDNSVLQAWLRITFVTGAMRM